MFRFTNFVLLELTLDCNLRCKYCYLREKDKYTGQVMSYETFCGVIDTVIAQRKLSGPRQNLELEVIFHGGEPTLIGEDALERFFSYAKTKLEEANLPFRLIIQTNATKITPRLAQIIKAHNVDLGISLDGMGENNTLRTNGVETQKRILEGIEVLKQEKVPFGMLTVVTKHNIHQVNELAKLHPNRKNKALLVTDISSPEDDRLEPTQSDWFQYVIQPTLFNMIHQYDSQFDASAMDYSLIVERTMKRAVMDILSYHSDNCQSTCGIKFCGSGMTIVSVQPDGMVNSCDRWDTKYSEVAKVMHYKDYDFCGIKQLQKAIHFAQIKDSLMKDAGCDTCYASYACTGQCESLYYSRYEKYGIDKKNLCEGMKKIYDFAIENLDDILEYYFRRGKGVLVFEEDFLFHLKQNNVLSLKFDLSIDPNNQRRLLIQPKEKA